MANARVSHSLGGRCDLFAAGESDPSRRVVPRLFLPDVLTAVKIEKTDTARERKKGGVDGIIIVFSAPFVPASVH